MDNQTFWVTTDRFEATTPGPRFINPRCFGEDFAGWLRGRLADSGWTIAEPIQEDWSWVLLATVAGDIFTIAIGVLDESIEQTPAVWRVDVSHEKWVNPIRKWFKQPPKESLTEVCRKLEEILSCEPQFKVSLTE
jgi:hypothetical protein